MTMPATQSKQNAETHLQRTLNTALNELGTDSALAAIFHQDQGPLVSHAARGFTPRDVQAILRTLSTQAVIQAAPQDQEAGRTVRLRLITPGAKSLLGMPLRHRQRTYGFLVIARKENATFAKKEKGLIEQAGDDITKALEREGLFDLNVVLSRPYVSREPGSGTREFTENYLRSAGISLDQMNVVMELGSPIALNGVVETGLGFAIASRASVTKEQRLGDIVAIPLKPRLIRTLSMVYPKEKFRSRLVATFVEFASSRLRSLMAAKKS